MKKELAKLYTNSPENDEPQIFQNNDLIKSLNEEFDFIAGFIPSGFDVAFLLMDQHPMESDKDFWNVVFFKKKLNLQATGTLTLDNYNENMSNNYEYEYYKILASNYHEVIQISTELLKKHG